MQSPYLWHTVVALAALLVFSYATSDSAYGQESQLPDHSLFASPVHEVKPILFNQEHVRLAIRFEPGSGQIYGTAKLRLRAETNAPDSLILDANDMDIFSIQVGLLDSLKQTAEYTDSIPGQLVVYLDSLNFETNPFEVQITYLSRPESGLYFNSNASDGPGVQAWTDMSSENASAWLPLINNPADLITSEIIATVSPEVSVLSNGRMTEQLMTEDGKTLYHFIQDQPHPPSDIGLYAGNFEIDSTRISLNNGFSFPISFWHANDRTEDIEASLEEIEPIVAFLSEYLDYTYPWPSHAVLIMDDVYIQDMTLTGLTIFNDDIIKDQKAIKDFPESFRIASLLARQWYTHLISTDFIADSWITESLATYLGLLYIKETYGESSYLIGLHNLGKEYFTESNEYQRPLVWNQWDHPDQLHDNHSRAKGVWVLHAIHKKLGDSSFQAFLQHITSRLSFKPTNTDQFLSELTAFTGLAFDAFFDDWIYSAGHPELSINYQYDHVSESLYVAIDQTQEGYLIPSNFALDLDIETYSLAGPESHPAKIESNDQLLAIPLAMPPRYVIAGPDHPYLALQEVEQEAAAWITQLRYASHPISQLQALDALATYTSDPALLIGLQSALRSRPGAEVRAGIVRLIAQMPHSEATLRTLVDAYEDESPLVQQAVLAALSDFEDTSDLTILAMEAAQNSESYVVQAEAVKTLAKINGPDAFSIIQSALITDSHRDIIRQAALESLFLLNISTRERIAIARDHSSSKHATEVRLAAINVLQTLAGYGNKQSRNLLNALLEDEEYVIREAVLDAFLEIGIEDDLEILTDYEENENDMRLQVKSRDVMTHIRSTTAEATSSE